jgi:hypothetical protein
VRAPIWSVAWLLPCKALQECHSTGDDIIDLIALQEVEDQEPFKSMKVPTDVQQQCVHS